MRRMYPYKRCPLRRIGRRRLNQLPDQPADRDTLLFTCISSYRMDTDMGMIMIYIETEYRPALDYRGGPRPFSQGPSDLMWSGSWRLIRLATAQTTVAAAIQATSY